MSKFKAGGEIKCLTHGLPVMEMRDWQRIKGDQIYHIPPGLEQHHCDRVSRKCISDDQLGDDAKLMLAFWYFKIESQITTYLRPTV